MRRCLLLAALLWVLCPVANAAPAGWQSHTLAGVTFSAPKSAEVTSRALPEGVHVVVVTHSDEVLILTLYRGKAAPAAKRALATHSEELERRVASAGDLRIGRDSVMMLGRKRKVHTIEHGPSKMRERTSLVAVRLTKTTVVASWTIPTKARRTMSSSLLKDISFE